MTAPQQHNEPRPFWTASTAVAVVYLMIIALAVGFGFLPPW